MPSLVLVFDFDRSLVPQNSDFEVADAMGRMPALKAGYAMYRDRLKADPETAMWTDLASGVFEPFTPAEVADAAGKTMQMDPSMVQLLCDVIRLRDAPPSMVSDGRCKLDAVDLFVISGANDALVSGTLRAHLGAEYFELLERRGPQWLHTHRCVPVTDPDLLAKGIKSRVDAYIPPSTNTCERCKYGGDPGLCKGAVVSLVRRRLAYKCRDATIAFVGDGFNDYCALSHLQARDVFFVHERLSLHEGLVAARQKPRNFESSAPPVASCKALDDDDVPNGGFIAGHTAHTRAEHGVCTIVPWGSYGNELAPALEALLYCGSTAGVTLRHGLELIDVSEEPGVYAQSQDKTAYERLVARLDEKGPLVGRRFALARRVLQAPLQCFGDDAESFRAITLTHRMPETLLHTVSAGGDAKNDLVSRRVTDLARAIATQPINCMLPHRDLQALRRAKAVAGANEAAIQAEIDGDAVEVRSFWVPAIEAAARASLLPWYLGGYASLGKSPSQETLGTLLESRSLSFTPLPWLHGEIFVHRLLPLIYGSGGGTMLNAEAAVAVEAKDHCPCCATAQGGSSATRAAADCGGCAYDRAGYLASAAEPWDFYAAEKAQSLASTLESHIIPVAAAFYSECCAVAAALNRDTTADESDAAREANAGRAVDLLHGAVLNSLWGNCVDLSLHRSSDVAATAAAHTASSPTTAATEEQGVTYASAFAALKAKEGLVGNHTRTIAERLWAAVSRRRRGEPGDGATRILDLVLDNAGVEVSADLVLATIVSLLSATPSDAAADDSAQVSVCLHTKAIPFYVSDVVPHDVGLALTAIGQSTDKQAAAFAKHCTELFSNAVIVVRPSYLNSSAREWREHGPELFERFFTRGPRVASSACSPVVPPSMRQNTDRQLTEQEMAEELKKANQQRLSNFESLVTPTTEVVVCKGDLNFRRLIGDRRWNASEAADWEEAAATFWPFPEECATPLTLVTLRTCKCEIVAGVSTETIVDLDAEHLARRPAGASRAKMVGDATEEVRAWVKSGWRVRGSHAVALCYPAPEETSQSA